MHTYNYDPFTLVDGRNQHSIVKQLYSNLKNQKQQKMCNCFVPSKKRVQL